MTQTGVEKNSRKYEEMNSLLFYTGQCCDMRLSHRIVPSEDKEGLLQPLHAVQMCAISQRSAARLLSVIHSFLPTEIHDIINLLTDLFFQHIPSLSLVLSEDDVCSMVSMVSQS